MVTVFSGNRMRKQAVFTDAQGRYLIVVDYEGELTIRARASSFADQTQKVLVGEAAPETVDLTVTAFESDTDRSNALPASAHLTALPWKDTEERAPFVAQCNYCHQVGNPLTRGKRSAESWTEYGDLHVIATSAQRILALGGRRLLSDAPQVLG